MKILLATDGSKHSDQTVEIIRSFRLTETDEIHVISVVDMAVPMAVDMYAGYLPSTPEIEKHVRENAERVLSETSDKLRQMHGNERLNISTEVLVGSPDSRIVETAEEINADLIVVGSHGYNRWERLLLGSVSDSVVHHAPCSVLVVRIPKE
ncbi:MAG: universal stress protein [Pyrinomonadaceae bacterium]|nr:universal stress protein [Pyrinomonadaceae bacterium]